VKIPSHISKNGLIGKTRPAEHNMSTGLIQRLYNPSEKPETFELPASAVTAKVVKALHSANPKPRYYITTPTYVMGFLRRVLPTRALDWLLVRM
jgi:hypothetical protein